jgi:hypothetical protein
LLLAGGDPEPDRPRNFVVTKISRTNANHSFGKRKPGPGKGIHVGTTTTMRQAVVCRCHDPSPAATDRLSQWAAQCNAAGIDFIISLDNTQSWSNTPKERRSRKRKRLAKHEEKKHKCGSSHTSPSVVSPTHRLLREFAIKGVQVHVHRYTEGELLRSFPALPVMQKYLLEEMKVYELLSGKCTMAWGFHVECLCLWWNHSKEKNQGEAKYDYIWVVEDDVGISQSITSLIREYENEESDLITDGAEEMAKEWFWKDVFSNNFNAKIGSHKIVAKEHVQRLSKKLMERLMVLTAKEGVCAWSEAFTSTVAFNDDALSMGGFKQIHLGEPYCWNGRVNREEWEVIKSEESDSSSSSSSSTGSTEGSVVPAVPKMYHALKF